MKKLVFCACTMLFCALSAQERISSGLCGFSVIKPGISRKWYYDFAREADQIIAETAEKDPLLKDDDDEEVKSSCGSVGVFVPAGSPDVYGLRLSVVESYYPAADLGVSYAVLASDIDFMAGLQTALAGNADTMYGVQVLPFFASSNVKSAGLQSSVIGAWSECGCGLQTALWAVVAGEYHGCRIAGAGTFLRREGTGFLFSGIVNYAGSDFSGMQFSGCFNTVNRNVYGFQQAGLFNSACNLRGAQIAAFCNFAQESANGLQLAFGRNTASVLRGAQIAVSYNSLEPIPEVPCSSGMQISLVNLSKVPFAGVQIGLYNDCENGRGGVQIGLINHCSGAVIPWLPLVNVHF